MQWMFQHSLVFVFWPKTGLPKLLCGKVQCHNAKSNWHAKNFVFNKCATINIAKLQDRGNQCALTFYFYIHTLSLRLSWLFHWRLQFWVILEDPSFHQLPVFFSQKVGFFQHCCYKDWTNFFSNYKDFSIPF